ncbi:transmembrane protein 45A-like [Meriones unguiculatus]|uniref:transmembrane protein 45A-like n=1 Tax=Meriones unguiculatus TaxID=10047 RepID=UPI000B4F9BF7|nr:transmembrane protein 45A-like [Meriones unguiculatus]
MNDSETRTGPGHQRVTGDFAGHALPGLLFFIMAFWWSMKSILKYVCKHQKRASFLITKNFFTRVEILEGIVLIGMAATGIIGLFSVLKNGGRYSDKEYRLIQILHWHHVVMYSFFALLGVTKILCFTISSLPVSLVKLMLSNAFLVEAFIFFNHNHGRMLVESFAHQLVSFAGLLAGLVAFIEFLSTKNNVALELMRSSFMMLQGMWFLQLAFILFPKDRAHDWNLEDPSNVSLFAVYFGFYYAVTYVIIGINYVLITWFIKWRLSKSCLSDVQLLKYHEQQEEPEDDM